MAYYGFLLNTVETRKSPVCSPQLIEVRHTVNLFVL